MKHLVQFILAVCPLICFAQPNRANSIDSSGSTMAKEKNPFTEGILYTRVSFPGNIINEALSRIDFEKGTIPEQMKALQLEMSSKAYADKVAAELKSMTAEQKASTGAITMVAMMSPLYAKIYYTDGNVLAKASALNFTMESFMNTQKGMGKMVVFSNDKTKEAAIEFSATSMREVWLKEEVDANKYEMKLLQEQEKVAGYLCKKVVYTRKKHETALHSPFGSPACKLIVWYSPIIDKDINFLHPFYIQLDKGILKIEVHYDNIGKTKMIYEVTGIKPQSLSATDFSVSDVEPVVNWDTDQAKASMNILEVMMSNAGQQGKQRE